MLICKIALRRIFRREAYSKKAYPDHLQNPVDGGGNKSGIYATGFLLISTAIATPKPTHQTLIKAFNTKSSLEVKYMPFWILKLKSRIPKNIRPPEQTRERVLPDSLFFNRSMPEASMVIDRIISGRGKECS